jgi:ATP phosphoribosyltransferase-like protein
VRSPSLPHSPAFLLLMTIPAAKKFILCQYNVPRHLLSTATKFTPGKRAPTITALEEQDWVAVSSMVEKEKIANVMDDLTGVGATDILVLDIANTRTSD